MPEGVNEFYAASGKPRASGNAATMSSIKILAEGNFLEGSFTCIYIETVPLVNKRTLLEPPKREPEGIGR